MREKYIVVDLFSGGGGYARGFEESDFKVIAAIDNYPPAAKTYKANFPHAAMIVEDIKDVTYRDIVDVTGYNRGDIDVVIASPPCEPFTSANPNRMKNPIDRLYSDPIGNLFLHAIRLIGEFEPEVFVIENVPGILEEPIKKAIRYELKRIGYDKVYFNILKAEDYGSPSERVRVFISNIKLSPPKNPGPTVEDSIKDLPEPGSPYPPNHEYPEEVPRRHKRRVAKLKWGESLIYFQGADNSKHPNYIKLHPMRRAPTIMGSTRLIHPYEPRLLTVREQARLMGFPDYHIFLGGRDSQYNMVGEAVPPPLAKAIADYIVQMIRKRIEGAQTVPRSRSL
ncbi:MAG: DNA cytosine methyltransferase [Acidilobaceae archaeon]